MNILLVTEPLPFVAGISLVSIGVVALVIYLYLVTGGTRGFGGHERPTNLWGWERWRAEDEIRPLTQEEKDAWTNPDDWKHLMEKNSEASTPEASGDSRAFREESP